MQPDGRPETIQTQADRHADAPTSGPGQRERAPRIVGGAVYVQVGDNRIR